MHLLPSNPNLDYLHRQARKLKSQHKQKDLKACHLIRHFDTSCQILSDDEIIRKPFSIIDAQRIIARKHGFASWRRLKLFIIKNQHHSNQYNAQINAKILHRQQKLSVLLKSLSKHNTTHNTAKTEQMASFRDFNKSSGKFLIDIFEQHGWPGPQIIGIDGVQGCFELCVHHSEDAEFQRNTAKFMKQAIPKGECVGKYYAFVIDRLCSLSYQPTIYATTCDFNDKTGRVELTNDVIDPQNLNKRRAEVGLKNFDFENNQLVTKLISSGQVIQNKEEWEDYKLNFAIKGGYINRV